MNSVSLLNRTLSRWMSSAISMKFVELQDMDNNKSIFVNLDRVISIEYGYVPSAHNTLMNKDNRGLVGATLVADVGRCFVSETPRQILAKVGGREV